MTNEINVNQDVLLLPSATRNATTIIGDQDNPYWRGCTIFINISQASGTGGLELDLDFKDFVSGNYYTVWSSPSADYLTTVGTFLFIVYPTAVNIGQSDKVLDGILPRTWRVRINHHDASNYTYSVGCSMIK